MFHVRTKNGDIEHLFVEGELTKKRLFSFTVNENKVSGNNKPTLIPTTDIKEEPEEDIDDIYEEFFDDDIDQLLIVPTNGDILNSESSTTILIPRLIVDNKPHIIKRYKWFKDDIFLTSQELFLQISVDDVVNKNSIYTLEVELEDKTLTEHIEIINISGMNIESEEEPEDQEDPSDDSDDTSEEENKYEFEDKESLMFEVYLVEQDFSDLDLFRIYYNIKIGRGVQDSYMRIGKRVQERVIENATRNRDRNIFNRKNIFLDVVREIERKLVRKYPDIYDGELNEEFAERRIPFL